MSFPILETISIGDPPNRKLILGLNFDNLTPNISKTVSRSVTCQLELNISLTRAFISHGAVALAESIISKNNVFFSLFLHHLSVINARSTDVWPATHASVDYCLSHNSTTLRYAMAVLFSSNRRAVSIAILSYTTCIRRRR